MLANYHLELPLKLLFFFTLTFPGSSLCLFDLLFINYLYFFFLEIWFYGTVTLFKINFIRYTREKKMFAYSNIYITLHVTYVLLLR